MKAKILIILILSILIMAGIVHTAVKSSGDKGLASEWNADHEITGDVDQNQNSFLNAVIENRTDFPAGPDAGQIIYRTDLSAMYVYDGTEWKEIPEVISPSYWTMPGTGFFTFTPLVDDITNDVDNGVFLVNAGANIGAGCPVLLPQGAEVTEVAMFGYGPWNWWMYRDSLLASGFPEQMASGSVLAPVTDAHGFALPNNDIVATQAGFQFSTKAELTVGYVVKDAACTATWAYILDSSKNVLYSANFSGNIATFGTNILSSGTLYYMTVDNAGANYTRKLNPANQAYPQNKTNIIYTGALDDTTDNQKAYNIVSIRTTQTSRDTTITGAEIDNSLYRYWIEVFPLDAGEEIDSARIIYNP